MLLVITLLSIACQNEKYKNSNEFDNDSLSYSKELVGETVIDSLLFPSKLYYNNSLLYLVEDNSPQMIHIFNTETKENVGKIVSKGRGPEEMINIGSVQFIPGSDNFWVLDSPSKILAEYKYALDEHHLVQQIKLEDVGAFNPLIIPSFGILANSRQTKPMGRFFLFNNDGTIQKTEGEYPSYGKEIPDMMKADAFLCISDVKPDFSKVVLAYMMTDLIEIYNNQGHLLKRVHGPDHFFPQIKTEKINDGFSFAPTSESKDAYVVVKAGSEEIWTLYADGKQPSRDYHHSTLLVFDWEGNPLRKYKLDKPIFYFDIDWENKVLYGLSHSPVPSIIRYKL